MRFLLGWAAGGLLASACGAAAAWVATGSTSAVEGRGPGPWTTSSGTGEASDSAFDRAVIARTGIWALPQSEVVYFAAEKDSSGQPLDADCTYELKGQADLPARWWSVVLYLDYFWVDNPSDRYSYSVTNVKRDPGGKTYTISVSRQPHSGNWLPLGSKDGKVTLLTRLYQPKPSVAVDPESVPLASIRRVACK